jgi:photosystem II stability/assembly factor-like uncharacterized protein
MKAVRTSILGAVMALSALAALACSSPGPVTNGAPRDAGALRDAGGLAIAIATMDGGSSQVDAGGLADSGDAMVRTIAPVMPGVWRDITPTQVDPTAHACTDLQFDPGHPSTLYAMFADVGVWKSTDDGSTWASIGNLPTPTSLGRLLLDPRDSSHLLATGSVSGSSLGFWVSHDGGQTWAIPEAFRAGAGTTWNFDVYNMVADPTDFDHVLLTFHSPWSCCGEAAGILETHDGGVSYTPHMPPAGMDHGQGIAFLYDPARSLGDASTWLVGAGYGAGLFRTADAGTTWNQVSTLQEDHGGFDAHYSSQGFLYLGASDGVHRSTDNGMTWQSESTGTLATWTYSVIGDGKFLYSSPGFVGQAYNQPFFVSPEGTPDEGEQWTPYSAQTIPEGPWKMEFDAANRIIYSATWNSGAWALTVLN